MERPEIPPNTYRYMKYVQFVSDYKRPNDYPSELSWLIFGPANLIAVDNVCEVTTKEGKIEFV